MANENLDPKALAESLQLLLKSKGTVKELIAQAKLYDVALGTSVQRTMQMEHSLNNQEKISKKLLGYASNIANVEQKRLAAAKLAENIDDGRLDIAMHRSQVEADMLLKQTMLKTGLIGVYAEQAKNLALAQKLGTITKEELAYELQQLKAQQKYTEHLEEELGLTEEISAKILEIKEESEAWKHSLTKVFETAKAIGRDPKVFGAFMLTQMAEKVHEVYEGFEQLSTSGLTVGQRIDSMAKGFSLMSMIGLSDTKGVLAGMVESMGTMNSLTSTEVDHVGHLAKEMGVTGQEAFGLVEGFSKLPGETMATAAHAADYVKSLSKANGVAPGKITKEIAKNTELIALGGYKGAKAFTDAAMKAQKMGVELSTTKNVMSGLLNFEDSINKQMEASVLLGKEINLDRARQLALEGKSVEATAEVLKNVGGQAEFDRMNVLEKEALAAASGMTVEELNKAVDAQAEYNKYHGEDVAAWKTGLGYAMEYGGAVGGFLKENGLLLLSTIQFMSQFNIMTKLGNGLLAIKNGLLNAGKALIGKDGGADKTKDLVSEKIKTPEVPAKAGALGAGKAAGGGMKGLASGFKAMAGGKVAQGILNLMLAGPALVLAVGSIPFLAIVSMIGIPAGIGLKGLAEGVSAMGKGSVMKGALALLVLGATLIPAAFAFSLLEGVSVEKIIAFSLALPLLALAAAGLGFIAPFIMAGAAALGILGVGMIAVAGGLMVLQAAEGGISIFESLAAVAANASGLGGVAMAMIGIAGGLGIMAYTGLAALPVIGALIALAAVAPALSGLGAALGGMFGGGGEEKEDKMDTLIAKIDTLISVASKGGVINMDGKKVGEVLRLSVNSAGIR